MQINTLERVGFIGLGVMGEAMCRNLIVKGAWPTTVFDLNMDPVKRMEQVGGTAAASAGDLVDAVDLVMICLPGGHEVRNLILGDECLIDRFRSGQVLIDMSTSQPSLMKEIAAKAQQRRIGFADAPIARTRQAAADGTLAIMVGADAGIFEIIKPVLSTMGTDVVHCGGPGAGQVVKIMNNMVLFQTVAALAEAVSLAEREGVDGQVLLDTLSKGSGDSFAARNHAIKSLLPQVYPERAFPVTYAAKDLSYAVEMGREHGIRTPGADHVAELFQEAIAAGDGDCYFPVIRKRLAERSDK